MGKPREKNDGRGRLGGRKKGTPNKITKEKREIIAKFIDDKWEDFILSFDAIDKPETKCSIMVQLLPFAFPKLAQIDYKDKTQAKTLDDELDEISGEKTRG